MDVGQISIDAPTGIWDRIKRVLIYVHWRLSHFRDELKRARVTTDDVRDAANQLEIEIAQMGEEADCDPLFVLYINHRRETGLRVWGGDVSQVDRWAKHRFGHVYTHAFRGAFRLSAKGVDPANIVLRAWSGMASKRRIREAIADGLACRAAFLEKRWT